MNKSNGLSREVDGTKYGICIENIPGKKRPIISAYIGNEYSAAKVKVAEVTDEDSLRVVFQGLFGGNWK